MCATCGCSDTSGVRIVDPETGQVLPLAQAGAGEAHEHVDAQGRVYSHTHSADVSADLRAAGPA